MLSLICGYKNCNALVNITKKEADSQIQGTNQWLPEGGGEGQYGGRGVGSTSCRVQDGSGMRCTTQQYSLYFVKTVNGV